MSPFPTSRTLIGRVVRMPLRVVRPTWQVPILSGTARGKQWIAGSGNAGHWLGTFEQPICRVFRSLIRPGMVVYEMGAYIGYYTLQASVLVGDSGHVYAFEPSPRNLPVVRRHLLINRTQNVTLTDVAVGERSGTASFREDTVNSALDRPIESGPLEVPIITLDEFVARPGIRPPDLLKIDVVGSEHGVLRGASELLRSRGPILLMRIHSFDLNPPWIAELRDLGYDPVPFEAADFGSRGGLVARRSS